MSKTSIDGKKTKQASSNWLALQKVFSHLPIMYCANFYAKLYLLIYQKLPVSSRKDEESLKDGGLRKKRKMHHRDSTSAPANNHHTPTEPSSFPRGTTSTYIEPTVEVDFDSREMKNGESISHLRKMVYGKIDYTPAQQLSVEVTLSPHIF